MYLILSLCFVFRHSYNKFFVVFCRCDELLMTEMIFNGLFNDLTVPQCVSLISCFVCDEKSSENPKKSEELSGPLRQMQVRIIFVALHLLFPQKVVEITVIIAINDFAGFSQTNS